MANSKAAGTRACPRRAVRPKWCHGEATSWSPPGVDQRNGALTRFDWLPFFVLLTKWPISQVADQVHLANAHSARAQHAVGAASPAIDPTPMPPSLSVAFHRHRLRLARHEAPALAVAHCALPSGCSHPMSPAAWSDIVVVTCPRRPPTVVGARGGALPPLRHGVGRG